MSSTSLMSGSEEGRGKRPAMDLARVLSATEVTNESVGEGAHACKFFHNLYHLSADGEGSD